MKELLNAAVSAPNLLPTALLVFVLVYWIVVILGAIDLDFIDLDLELGETEADGVAEGEFSAAWLNAVLSFFNLGQVPFMVFLTFLIIPIWVISVMGNYYLDNTSFGISMLLFMPNLVISLFIAKFLTMPFIGLFRTMDQETGETMIGKICTVTSTVSSGKVGQAKVKTTGAPLLLNVLTYNEVTLQHGDTGIVIDRRKDRNIYFIEPYIN